VFISEQNMLIHKELNILKNLISIMRLLLIIKKLGHGCHRDLHSFANLIYDKTDLLETLISA